MPDGLAALAALFAMAVGTAVVPLPGVEVFLVGVVLMQPGVPWWLAGLVAAAGQLGGKAVHVGLARRVGAVPRVSSRLAPTVLRCRRRPRTLAATVLLSSTTGVPPFTALVPAVAVIGVDLRRLVPIAALGRTARFVVLAGIPELLRWA